MSGLEMNEHKTILEDFYWVTYCTENYEHLLNNLLQSIDKFSNRKVIVFTINYSFDHTKNTFYNSSQYEFFRYDIEEGDKDIRGRDFNVISSKPKICSKVIEIYPNQKFIYIDTDIHFTTTTDDLGIFLSDIKKCPIFNSHIHDIIYVSNIIQDEMWSDTVGLIMRELGINEPRIFPRRKTNIIFFDRESNWFFIEQMNIFHSLREKNKLNLLSIYDEDSANVVLTKYNLNHILPILDIEEEYDLNMDKFKNYSYSMTPISESVKLPSNLNEIYCFHGFKKDEDYQNISSIYGNSVLSMKDITIRYENNTLLFDRNVDMMGKQITNEVSFIITNVNNQEIFRLTNQNLFNYVLFYISDLILNRGIYNLKIVEQINQRIIYNNFFEVK